MLAGRGSFEMTTLSLSVQNGRYVANDSVVNRFLFQYTSHNGTQVVPSARAVLL